LPHIYVKDFETKPFFNEVEFDEVRFSFLGHSLRSAKNYILFSKFKEKEFFLELKKRGNRVLIKSEKSSRVSPNFPIHKAISSFAKMENLEVLSSNLNLKESEHIPEDGYLKNLEFFNNNISSFDNKIEIEIGFGSGRHILHKAENNPDITFIGIEIHKASIEQVIKQIKIRNLKNLYILDFDARYFLESLPSNRISKIYVHFPVPWDKKPHRRVIQKTFLSEAKRVLEVGGVLELRTDSENYFESASKLFSETENIKVDLTKNEDIEIVSKYESRWKKLDKNIYNFQVTNLESSTEKEKFHLEKSFEIQNRSNIPELLGQTILKNDWFINFRDIYKIQDNIFVLSLVAGSYSYPNTIFLLLNRNKIEYLIKKPLELKANVEIDKYLREWL
jgi:tRNA (guanine-N7-)-methyltransferase